jgi:hypothetical protein
MTLTGGPPRAGRAPLRRSSSHALGREEHHDRDDEDSHR